MPKKKLNLGCGEDYLEGYVNVDFSHLVRADLVHDLNVLPYLFTDNTFDEVIAFHIIEHLDKPFLVMKELHRIIKPGGRLHIKVPHFSRGFSHAEHRAGFDVMFPHYFNRNFTKSGYFGVDFKLAKLELHWMAFFDIMRDIGINPALVGFLRILNAVISFMANLSPNFCSRIWCFWVGGFEEIEFEFICNKETEALNN
jgi:SAM-dependent methyltransferase